MARLGRSSGRDGQNYELRPPTVLFSAVFFYGPGVKLAPPLTSGDVERRRPNSTLRPPAVIDAAAPSEVFSGPRIELAKPRPRWQVKSRLYQPAVVAEAVVEVYSGPKTKLVGSHRPAPTRGNLRPPIVLDPAITYGPVRASFVEARKPRLVQSKLRPPTVIDVPPQPPTDVSIGVKLAPSRDVSRRFAKPELRPPSVVDPAVVYPSVDTKLVPSPRQARGAHHKLRGPAVVAPVVVYRPVEVTLIAPALEMVRHSSFYRLREPTVVTALSDVIHIDYYDHPRPGGILGSSPSTDGFDLPKPIGEVDP